MSEAARMIVASRLRDGRTVFLAAGAQWVVSIRRGAVARTADDCERLLALARDAAERHVVIGPYAIDVSDSGSGPVPVSWRECIRARGPTVEDERAA